VTPKYRHLVHYIIDEGAEEIVILTIQHPARSREYRDASFGRTFRAENSNTRRHLAEFWMIEPESR
jgi:aspartyl/asparaginyl-tRNA synthetase